MSEEKTVAVLQDVIRIGKMQAEWVAEAVPLLRRLANEAWMRQDFKTNAEICRLLGEKSALEHELGEDAP